MAAVLVAGPGAALSHSSAAALWGIGREQGRGIEVSVPATRRCRLEGVIAHRRPSLRAEDITTHRGIPVASPTQTLIDLAARHGQAVVERMVNEADKLDLIDPEALRTGLDDHPGEPGVARLRALLDRRTFRLTRSELERWFLPLARGVDLPPPLTGQWVNGFEVDFHWPDLDLVVETDGLRYHRTPAAQARDRLRDQAHIAAGTASLRFTHEQVRYDPDYVRRMLRTVAGRIRARNVA